MKVEMECLNSGNTRTFSHSLLDCKCLFCLEWKEIQQKKLKEVGGMLPNKLFNSIVSIKFVIFIAIMLIYQTRW